MMRDSSEKLDIIVRKLKHSLRRIYVPAFDLVRGRWPYPLFWMRRMLATREPETFSEKIRYKMVRDRRPLLTTMADKIEARRYVQAKVGSKYLVPEVGVYCAPDDVSWRNLPREFVCKVSHASGGMILVTDKADPSFQLPTDKTLFRWRRFMVHPDQFDPERATNILKYWMERRWGWGPATEYEWGYKEIEPRLLFEEFLNSPEALVPSDYKLYIFNGECKLIHVDSSRMDRHSRDLYTPNWDYVDVEYEYPQSESIREKPEELSEMIEVGEALGEETDFVRVDLYSLKKRVFFGELTHYPECGRGEFRPVAFDHKLGQFWSLPDDYGDLPETFMK